MGAEGFHVGALLLSERGHLDQEEETRTEKVREQ